MQEGNEGMDLVITQGRVELTVATQENVGSSVTYQQARSSWSVVCFVEMSV
jgi:hypothetical protein